MNPRCALALVVALSGYGVRLTAQDVVVGQELGWVLADPPPDVMPKWGPRLRPEFPEEMRKTSEPGYAIITQTFDPAGTVTGFSYVATHPPYERAAVEALRGAQRAHDARLTVAKRNGKPVAGQVWASIIFNPKSAALKGPDATPRLLAVTLVHTRDRSSKGPKVRMHLNVDETGAVTAVTPDAGVQLEERLLSDINENVRAWRFAPARKEGKPIPAEVVMTVLCQPLTTATAAAAAQSYVPAKAITRVIPEYPPFMRRFAIAGKVMVEFEIDTDGKVINPVVRESDIPPFDEPAIKAVLQWKFEPAMRNGRPVKSKSGFGMTFNPDNVKEEAGIIRTHDASDQTKLPAELRYDVPAKFRSVVVPIYPYQPRLDGARGKASVTILVDEKGRVAQVKLLSADRPEFGAALIAAAENFRFDPAYRDGKPVIHAFRFDQEFNYTALDDEAGQSLLSLEKKHPERIVSADKLDAMPTPLSRRSPVFPLQIPAEVASGDATIEFLIDTDGHARLPRVVSASDPAFGYAAVQAVGTWLFSAPLVDGKPVVTRLRVPLNFTSIVKKPTPAPHPEPAVSEIK